MSGIYIHIPFCKQACFYCDFHFSTSLKKKDDLVACLVKELEIRKNELEDEIVETIYFGGGTPSLLLVDELELLINTVRKNYRVSENPEITLEANPDDLVSVRAQSRTVFDDYIKIGINRLSIGIQSFFEDDLIMMNRAHSANEARACLSMATQYFDNITVDLIYGIPNMSAARWKKNLQLAFDFGINHISSYALTVEPKTALDLFIKQGKYPPLNEELAKQHFDILVAETKKQGFVHYEISNFGKPHYFSKHNISYWLGKKYLGIGPSAHSFSKTHRSWNVANNTAYIKSIKQNKLPVETEKLSVNDRFNESVMTGLRTIWGISLEQVEQDFGSAYKEKLLESAEKFITQDLLVIASKAKQSVKPNEITLLLSAECQISNNGLVLKTTQKGSFLADGIAADLFII